MKTSACQLFLLLLSFPFNFVSLSTRRPLLPLQLRCLHSNDVDNSAQVPLLRLQAVVDAFCARAEAAIYTSLVIFMLFVYRLVAPFATLTLNFGHGLPQVHHTSVANCPVMRQRLFHCQAHKLDQYRTLPADALLRLRARCHMLQSRVCFFTISKPLLHPPHMRAHVVAFDRGFLERDFFHHETNSRRRIHARDKSRYFESSALPSYKAVTHVHWKRCP